MGGYDDEKPIKRNDATQEGLERKAKAAAQRKKIAQQKKEQEEALFKEKERVKTKEKDRQRKFEVTENTSPNLPKIVKSKVDLEHLQDESESEKLLSATQINQVSLWLNQHSNIQKMSRKEEFKDNAGNFFTIPFSVVKSEGGELYALYQGKNDSRLGTGNFGSVKLIQNLTTGEWSAVKIQKINEKSNINKTELQSESEFMEAVGQMLGKQSLNKDNYQRMNPESESKELFIMPLHSALQFEAQIDDFNKKIEQIPNVEQALRREEILKIVSFSINAALTSFEQLHQIHSKGIIHRDLHPGNILVDDQGYSTVIDFGLSVKIDSPESKARVKGRLDTQSPEALAAKRIGEAHQYTIQDDIYALGQSVEKFRTSELIEMYGTEFGIPEVEVENAYDLFNSLATSADQRPTVQQMVNMLTNIQSYIKRAELRSNVQEQRSSPVVSQYQIETDSKAKKTKKSQESLKNEKTSLTHSKKKK